MKKIVVVTICFMMLICGCTKLSTTGNSQNDSISQSQDQHESSHLNSGNSSTNESNSAETSSASVENENFDSGAESKDGNNARADILDVFNEVFAPNILSLNDFKEGEQPSVENIYECFQYYIIHKYKTYQERSKLFIEIDDINYYPENIVFDFTTQYFNIEDKEMQKSSFYNKEHQAFRESILGGVDKNSIWDIVINIDVNFTTVTFKYGKQHDTVDFCTGTMQFVHDANGNIFCNQYELKNRKLFQ